MGNEGRRRHKDRDGSGAGRSLKETARYRALEYALREAQYLEDLADHKVRFAAVIMASLNAAVLLFATRTDLRAALGGPGKAWMIAGLLAYGAVAFGFFVHAVWTLWPRGVRGQPIAASPSFRHFEDIVKISPEAYLRSWRELDTERLNADMARRVYQMAVINKAKYTALDRMYLGLLIVTILSAVLIASAIGILLG